MSVAKPLVPISVADYLAGELVSDVKHEYTGGYVYAMAGGTNAHNKIAGNYFAAMHTPCAAARASRSTPTLKSASE